MELWIRSQNKHTLIKCNYITTLEKDIYGNTEYTIINEDELELGRYDSEKRLLEVLDEIQRILHPTVFMSAEINTDDNNWVENGIIYQKYKDNFNIQELSTYVYEMPKD